MIIVYMAPLDPDESWLASMWGIDYWIRLPEQREIGSLPSRKNKSPPFDPSVCKNQKIRDFLF